MIFRHIDTPEVPALTREDTPSGRWYNTPDGRYPSMTTALDASKDKTQLVKWRERIGEAEAERIRSSSGEVGTRLHTAIEDFTRGFMPEFECERSRSLFRTILPYLASIDEIRHTEVGLYSNTLRVAGTADCIANYDGVLSVVDYKNALRTKRREYIESYFLQTAGYAVMYRELTGIDVTRGVVLISSPDGPQKFVIKVADYETGLRRVCAAFWTSLPA